ncbi:MAG: histidine kinase dimerization/phosphoacceptor domain -containing protein [Xanthobacteraceae bacterium]
MSLRSRLTVLVAIAAVPSLALVAYNTMEWRGFLERQAGEQALASARQISAELTQLAEGTRHLMLTITRHPSVPDNEAECAAHFSSVIEKLAIYREAALIDREGRFHCSTVAIPPTLDVRDRIYFREPLRTGKFTIGTITVGRVTGERSLHVSMPYQSPDKRFDGVIVFILNPDRIAREFARRAWPADQRLSVLDREGSLVFTVPPTDEVAARAIGREAFERTQHAPGRALIVRRPQGTDEIVGFTPLDEDPDGLFVAVGIDLDIALAPLWDTAWRSTILALIAILLALLGTTLAAMWLLQRPVLAMLDTARRQEAGDTNAQFPKVSGRSELGQLSTALSSMSEKVNGLLEQKEFLLRELQHRVMNSLQILSSLLLMQSRHASDPATREQLQQARERVLSMGTVYRHLYRTETVGPLEFGEFLRLICAESERAYGGASGAKIVVETEPLFVSGGTATSLAVLMHELITNALKHAYAEGTEGTIKISMQRTKRGRIEFRVADRGRGMPDDFDIDAPTSLGFKVITATIRRFGGTLSINRLDPGTEFLIAFPRDLEVSEAAA